MSGCSLTRWTTSASSCTRSSPFCHQTGLVWPPIPSGSHRMLLPALAALHGSNVVSRGVHSVCCGSSIVILSTWWTFFLENLIVPQLVKKFPTFVRPEDSKIPPNRFYPEPFKYSPHLHILFL
jgi:hypothetical protein